MNFNLLKKLDYLWVFALLIVVALACNFSTARISDAKLAKGFEKGEAVSPTSTFSTNDKEVHCIVNVANAPDNTKVLARMIAVKAEGLDPDFKVVETDVNIGSNNNFAHFTFTLKNGLPAGDYKVDVYLNPDDKKNKEPVRTLPFTVVNEGGSAPISTNAPPTVPPINNNTPPPVTSNAAVTAVLTQDKAGRIPVSSFSTSSEFINCHVVFDRPLDATTKVNAKWTIIKVEGYNDNSVVSDSPSTLQPGTSSLNTYLEPPQGGFPPGRFRVDILVNDQLATSVPFQILAGSQ